MNEAMISGELRHVARLDAHAPPEKCGNSKCGNRAVWLLEEKGSGFMRGRSTWFVCCTSCFREITAPGGLGDTLRAMLAACPPDERMELDA